jgi:4,5-DOPA dioxygenase extradiol
MSATLPVILLGRGDPMNALMTNLSTKGWRQLGEQRPRPHAVLSISAHWLVPKTGVTVSMAPKTIHDFGGFPRELCGL